MAARSIVNQGLLLQKEATSGTPIIAAMKRYLGIKGTAGWDITEEYFRASGYKADTGKNVMSELGTLDMEVIQDYNAMLPILTGVFGAPTTTELGSSTGIFQHVFKIKPKAADDLVTFTAMWGDATQALQMAAVAFHAMTIGIQRTQLSLSAEAIARAPITGVGMPSSGVTEVPMIPMRAQNYCAYMDPTWATLGTTKLLALYNSEHSFGAKYAPDWIIDCALTSYASLMEQEDIDYTQNLSVGFDATAISAIDDSMDGKLKFVRIISEGPKVKAAETDKYTLQIDTSVSLKPTSVGASPVSPATVINFEGKLMVDGVSGNLAEVTLINDLAAV